MPRYKVTTSFKTYRTYEVEAPNEKAAGEKIVGDGEQPADPEYRELTYTERFSDDFDELEEVVNLDDQDLAEWEAEHEVPLP
jgi:hypothetical protein